MRKAGYTLQDQIKDVTASYAHEVGEKLGEHGFRYRHHIEMTENGMRFVFEACIKDDWPGGPLPKNWTFSEWAGLVTERD